MTNASNGHQCTSTPSTTYHVYPTNEDSTTQTRTYLHPSHSSTPGDEDDHIGRPREEDEPRGLPRRGGCREHSPIEVEERLLDNHAWTWNKNLSIIYHPRGCKTCMEYGRHVMEAELMKDDDYVIACKGRKEEANFW